MTAAPTVVRIPSAAASGRSALRLHLATVTLAAANAYVADHHRHHGRVAGHKFSLGAFGEDAALHGVAVVGRPVARHRDDGSTLEVTRLCTDGTPNACSFLYGAAWRAARALGYSRLGTYVLAAEPGTSLRAAGWRVVREVRGQPWSREARPRSDRGTSVSPKRLWEVASCP